MDFKWQVTALGQTNAVLINQKFGRHFPPLQPAAVQHRYCLEIKKKKMKKANQIQQNPKRATFHSARQTQNKTRRQAADSSGQGRRWLLAITTEPFPQLQWQIGMTQRSQDTHFKAKGQEKVSHFHCEGRCVHAPAATIEFSREPWSATWPQFYCLWLRLIQL